MLVVLGVDLIVIVALAVLLLGRRRWMRRRPGTPAAPSGRSTARSAA